MGKISCCYKCEPPKRHPGCHATCEEYIRQKEEWEAIKEKYQAERLKEIDLTHYDVERHDRVKKHYGRK